jgi:hypothetical protein
MDRETLRKKAIETVDGLMADIESSAKRGAAVFGASELLTSLIPSFIGVGCGTGIKYDSKICETYIGERRNLKTLLGGNDWISTFDALSELIALGLAPGIIKPGDYIRLPVKVEEAHFGSSFFAALDIEETEAVVVHVFKDKIAFNFEEVLFCNAINKNDINVGGFKNSALSYYLNAQFIHALDPITGILAKNKDGNPITLPTYYEVCGDDEVGNDVNWEEEPRQLEYFKLIKNCIRVKDNYTKCWWFSSPYTDGSTNFIYMNRDGYSASYYASKVDVGVAPAFCVCGSITLNL